MHASEREPEVTGPARRPRPDRREEILAAAEALVTDEGLAAVSVRAVADRAGIGASTLRYWFPSQDDLISALARRRLHPHLEDFRIGDASVPAADRLTECLAQFLPASPGVLSSIEQWVTMLGTVFGPGAVPLQRATYAGALEASVERLEGWLSRLVEEGALPAERVGVAVPTLLTRLDGLALGLLRPGAVPDLATAMAVLRADVEALLRPAGSP